MRLRCPADSTSKFNARIFFFLSSHVHAYVSPFRIIRLTSYPIFRIFRKRFDLYKR